MTNFEESAILPLCLIKEEYSEQIAVDQEVAIAEQPNAQVPETNRLRRMANWTSSHKGWLLTGGFLASAALSVTANPAGHTVHQAEQVAPWVVPGVIAAEAAWIGGAAMCIASAGEQNLKTSLRHPIETKNRFSEIAKQASSTKLFKAGFIINTTAAVAEFAIPAAAVVTHLPPETWGVLSFSVADLGLTVAIRKAIVGAVRDNSETAD